jgi:hypothetical protein
MGRRGFRGRPRGQEETCLRIGRERYLFSYALGMAT